MSIDARPRWSVLGGALLALAWQLALPLYDTPRTLVAAPLAALGVAALLRGGGAAIEGRSRAWLIAVPIALWLPWPAGLALALAACAAWFSRRRFAAAAEHAAAVVALQVGLLVACMYAGEALPEPPVLRYAAAAAARLVGLGAELGPDRVSVDCGDHWLALRVGLDSSGLGIAVLMLAPIWLLAPSLRESLLYLASAVAFGFARFAILLALCVALGGDATPLLDPAIQVASWLPFAALLFLLAPRRAHQPPAATSRRSATVGVCAAGALIGWIGMLAIGWVDPGERKAGVVLVDDAHGVWEQGTLEPGLDDFGTDSIYNYSALWSWLGRHYDLRIRDKGALDARTLAGVDVLVLKMPSIPFTADELDAVEAWVRAGGGLWVLGDHTDVFGTTTCLEPLLGRFAVEIGRDVGVLLYTKHVGNYRHHPSSIVPDPIADRIPVAFDFQGTASVRCTSGMPDHALLCTAQVLDAADYRDGSFFGNTKPTLDDRAAPFYALVARSVERGRVVVWGDSTVFSVFACFTPGKPEVVAAIVDYLNRMNGASAVVRRCAQAVFPVLPWLFCALLLAVAARLRMPLLVGAALGVAAGSALGHVRGAELGRLPSARAPEHVVGFFAPRSVAGIDVPLAGGREVEQPREWGAYSTVFAAVTRVAGCVPRVVTSAQDLAGVDLLVVLDQPQPLSSTERAALLAAVDRGMRLLVADPRGGSPWATELLSETGMRVRSAWSDGGELRRATVGRRSYAAIDSELLAPFDTLVTLAGEQIQAAGERLAPSGMPVLEVEGGSPRWLGGGGRHATLASVPAGRGQVFAFAGSAALESRAMGQLSDEVLAWDRQRASYVLLDALLREVLELAPAPASSASSVVAGDPQARELLRRCAERSRARTLRGSVVALGRHGDQASFAVAFAMTDGERTLCVTEGDTGDEHTGPRTRMHASRAGVDMFVSDTAVMRVPRREQRDAGTVFSMPAAWLDLPWRLRWAEADPRAEHARHLRYADPWKRAAGLRRALEVEGTVPSENWTERPDGTARLAVLSCEQPFPLGGEWLGHVELWLDPELAAPRKVVLSLRPRNEPTEASWYRVLLVYGDYAERDGGIGLPLVAPQAAADELRIEQLRGPELRPVH